MKGDVCVNIINIEKLDGYKTIVLTGRDENVRVIAKHLQARLYYAPRVTDHFEDYPMVAEELQKSLECEKGVVIITTQSKEFLDCLLQSDIDFAMVTVRKYDTDDDNTYRIRVLTKEDAWANRCAWNMELRN